MGMSGPGAGGPLTGAAADDLMVTELYRQYRGPLLLFVLRLTAGDRQQAEDIVQETMVRAWRRLAGWTWPSRRSCPGWPPWPGVS